METKKHTIYTQHKKLLADTYTPVSIYLKLRDKFANSILLESSDYHGNENSFSYICCEAIATFKVSENKIFTQFPDGSENTITIDSTISVPTELTAFSTQFESEKNDFKFIHNGLFGYINYDAVRYFETLEIPENTDEKTKTPDVLYHVYKYVIAINHFNNEMYLFEHSIQKNNFSDGLETLEKYIQNKNYSQYPFTIVGEEKSNYSDAGFLEIIRKGKAHCHRGDVFQIVLSRQFLQQFQGDDFNVYRALRSINPSPYLFYFDYGNFKIFGSSPEAQITIKNKTAAIYPIAGTFRRTDDEKVDAELAEKLKIDAKENAEHVMLVDLARNDLSRNCENVKVEIFREVHYYSHVIHLVSKVLGKVKEKNNTLNVVANTFPAGTLSGAPKHKAIQLIRKYENKNRGFYGGCIGFMSFDGDFNHAIMIRSFLSKNNFLISQAGAGIVDSSNEQSELNEVGNKLAALKKAIELAEKI
ncbi:MAG: anthranilate synthase component I family protein [Bacteroidia bacterium]